MSRKWYCKSMGQEFGPLSGAPTFERRLSQVKSDRTRGSAQTLTMAGYWQTRSRGLLKQILRRPLPCNATIAARRYVLRESYAANALNRSIVRTLSRARFRGS